jgi:hypothetical protein
MLKLLHIGESELNCMTNCSIGKIFEHNEKMKVSSFSMHYFVTETDALLYIYMLKLLYIGGSELNCMTNCSMRKIF